MSAEETKTCQRCGVVKPLSEYHQRTQELRGSWHYSRCKACYRSKNLLADDDDTLADRSLILVLKERVHAQLGFVPDSCARCPHYISCSDDIKRNGLQMSDPPCMLSDAAVEETLRAEAARRKGQYDPTGLEPRKRNRATPRGVYA